MKKDRLIVMKINVDIQIDLIDNNELMMSLFQTNK